MIITVRRGDVFYADLDPVVGSEQGGLRPVLIVQNDVGNRHSPTVIAAAITSRMGKTRLPTHIDVYAGRTGLSRDSIVLLEQLRTLDKRRLREKMGHLDDGLMQEIDTALGVSLGLLPRGVEQAVREENAAARATVRERTPILTTPPTPAVIPAAAAYTGAAAAVASSPAATDATKSHC